MFSIFPRLLLMSVSLLAFTGSPVSHAGDDFYGRRYYPVPQSRALPGSGTYIVFSGIHSQREGLPANEHFKPFINGTDDLRGLFFINVDAAKPEFSHWSYDENNPKQETDLSINMYGYKLFVQPDLTYAGILLPALPQTAGYRNDALAFSADGQWYAYRHYKLAYSLDKDYQLLIRDLNGDNLQVLFDSKEYIAEAGWSPDSQQIAFVSIVNLLSKDKSKPKSYVVRLLNRSDKSETVLYKGDKYFQNPTFTADGKHLLLTYDNLIQSLNIKTGKISTLYQAEPLERSFINEKGHKVYRTIKGFEGLRWSPDNTKLAFFYKSTLYTMDADGLNVETVIKPAYLPNMAMSNPPVLQYVWLADSRRLVYKDSLEDDRLTHSYSIKLKRSSVTRNYRLYLINADGTDKQVLSSKHIDPKLIGSVRIEVQKP